MRTPGTFIADNPSLNAFYVNLGFVLQGRFDASSWSANLYEREIIKTLGDLPIG